MPQIVKSIKSSMLYRYSGVASKDHSHLWIKLHHANFGPGFFGSQVRMSSHEMGAGDWDKLTIRCAKTIFRSR